MKMPGFTADVSIYRSSKKYSVVSSVTSTEHKISPTCLAEFGGYTGYSAINTVATLRRGLGILCRSLCFFDDCPQGEKCVFMLDSSARPFCVCRRETAPSAPTPTPTPPAPTPPTPAPTPTPQVPIPPTPIPPTPFPVPQGRFVCGCDPREDCRSDSTITDCLTCTDQDCKTETSCRCTCRNDEGKKTGEISGKCVAVWVPNQD